jgi:hypothetical protein
VSRAATRRLAAAALVCSLLSPAAAVAGGSLPSSTPPECSAPPLAYTGTDDVVREVRLLREDARQTCLVARSVGNQAHDDAGAAHSDQTAALALLDTIATAPAPDSTSVAFTAADTARFEATRYGVWFVAGLGCVGLLLPAIRKYWP